MKNIPEHPLEGCLVSIEMGGSRLNKLALELERSCHDCGEPWLRAGKKCPACHQKFIDFLEASGPAMVVAFTDHFQSRPGMTHSFKHGLIDPLTREGKKLLDG